MPTRLSASLDSQLLPSLSSFPSLSFILPHSFLLYHALLNLLFLYFSLLHYLVLHLKSKPVSPPKTIGLSPKPSRRCR
ncbi:hypothetical protein BDV11DRAFT_190136 [Aspergillus similis]